MVKVTSTEMAPSTYNAKRKKSSPPPVYTPRLTTAYLSQAFNLSTLPASHRRSVAKLIRHVRAYFARHDASHDFHHICRVVRNAASLMLHEQGLDSVSSQAGSRKGCHEVRRRKPRRPRNRHTHDGLLVLLGALVHDIGDHKYTHLNQKITNMQAGSLSQMLAQSDLQHHLPALCDKLLTLIPAVSYSTERKNPDLVARTIAEIPETAIVQDADRLDALGAIGVGRTFTYNATTAAASQLAEDTGKSGGDRKESSGMLDPVLHCYEKLLRLQDGMKTDSGRKEARRRTTIVEILVREWQRELFWAAPGL